jgi:type IV pilus assembly protein PilQ
MKRALLAIMLTTLLCTAALAAVDRGPLVSLELRDVEIKEVMRAIGQEHGINVIVDDSITGKVTVSLRSVPLWDALDSILKSKGYTYRVEPGGVVIVEPADAAITSEEDMIVREFKLKYLDSSSVLGNVSNLLTSKGKASAVPSKNLIIVADLPLGVERIENLIERLDQKPQQIMIEARIVEISTSYSRELGVQWGRSGYRNPTSAFNRPGSFETGFEVNLPKPSSTGGDLIFGTVVSSWNLDLRLSALEDTGDGKILSQPKILVIDNQEAEITSGTEILVPSIVNSTAFAGTLPEQAEPRVLEANLSLNVTPRVVGEDLLSLTIDTRREEFDFSRSIQGFPPKESRSAKTELLVRNGETIVIGGIYTKNNSVDESGVPFLRKIPILGWLFKSQTKRDTKKELLIFLTPTVEPDGQQEQWSQQTP